jgi:DNA-binding response OmpR family regulator
VFLIRTALKEAGIDAEIDVAKDGEQAIRYFDELDRDDREPCPALVILDINLPRRHGGEVLQHMRSSRKCAGAPVLAVSTSDSTRDRDEMSRLGANGYFKKPSDYSAFMQLGAVIKHLLEPRQ